MQIYIVFFKSSDLYTAVVKQLLQLNCKSPNLQKTNSKQKSFQTFLKRNLNLAFSYVENHGIKTWICSSKSRALSWSKHNSPWTWDLPQSSRTSSSKPGFAAPNLQL
jgi:hypothetical protein